MAVILYGQVRALPLVSALGEDSGIIEGEFSSEEVCDFFETFRKRQWLFQASKVPPDRPEPVCNLHDLSYPLAKELVDYHAISPPSAPHVAKLATADAMATVVAWYRDCLARESIFGTRISAQALPHDGVLSYSSQEVAGRVLTERGAIHDYEAHSIPDRPVDVWAATIARHASEDACRVVTIVVTRAQDEDLTHVALSCLGE
jgi:hypothetical protein